MAAARWCSTGLGTSPIPSLWDVQLFNGNADELAVELAEQYTKNKIEKILCPRSCDERALVALPQGTFAGYVCGTHTHRPPQYPYQPAGNTSNSMMFVGSDEMGVLSLANVPDEALQHPLVMTGCFGSFIGKCRTETPVANQKTIFTYDYACVATYRETALQPKVSQSITSLPPGSNQFLTTIMDIIEYQPGRSVGRPDGKRQLSRTIISPPTNKLCPCGKPWTFWLSWGR